MKLQRSTVILVAAALLLGGVVLVTQSQQQGGGGATTEQTDATVTPVYEFAEADVVFLQIETAAQTVVFEKNADGFWQMLEPNEQPAEEAAIAFLLSRLVTDGLVNTTTIEAASPADFGLDEPFATVDLTLADGTTHTLIVGDPDFSGQNYYALIDPETFPLPREVDDIEVAIVGENIFNGVDRPLEEWQAVVQDSTAEGDANSEETGEDLEEPTDDETDSDSETLEESGNNSEESGADR
jgi:preprotein translocase subunit SecG